MIENQAQGDHVAGDDLAIPHHRFGRDPAHTQDGGFRKIDNGCEGVDVVGAKTGDCEGAATDVIGQDATAASLLKGHASRCAGCYVIHALNTVWLGLRRSRSVLYPVAFGGGIMAAAVPDYI